MHKLLTLPPRSVTTHNFITRQYRAYATHEEMAKFSEKYFQMNHEAEITARLDAGSHIFNSTRPRPVLGTMAVYDYSTIPTMARGVRIFQTVSFASFYGIYHYTFISPHSLSFLGCCGLSFFCIVSMLN